MNVFVIRHGETDWNKEWRLQGRTQIRLNERGREQARETAAGLKKQGIIFDRVYSSPLLRAVETAEILSGFTLENIATDERIIELCFGKAEGTTPDERKENPLLQGFNNFFDAIYWATVSLTTVGYGDIYPITTLGRIVTMVSSIVGIAVVALPASILTAGYMSELKETQENKSENK